MSESESDVSKQSDCDVLLYYLPVNVLEFICQLLIDSSSHEFHLMRYVRTLRDVISLRASCTAMNDVIKDMTLFMPCSIESEWAFHPRNHSYYAFIDFMGRETNWRFRYLQIKAKMMMPDSNLMPFLQQNENLFGLLKNVKIWFNMEEDWNETITDVLFDWLNRVALKNAPEIEVISSLNFSILDRSMVTSLVLLRNHDRVIPDQLWFYSNLRELCIYDMELQVEHLTAFPNLRKLEVNHLVKSRRVHDASSIPKFDQIKSLIICLRNSSNPEHLPDIVSSFFPSLEYFEFSGRLCWNHFFNLPKTCNFVRTRLSSLRYFNTEENCIKNISLYCVGDLTIPFGDIKFVSGGVSILEVAFVDESTPASLTGLIERVFDLLDIFRSLEVLSISLSLADRSRASDPLVMLSRGKISGYLINFFQSQTELAELCRKRNLQLLILGKIALIKSARSDLLKNVDNMEFKYGCMLRPGNGSLLPLELLTETSGT